MNGIVFILILLTAGILFSRFMGVIAKAIFKELEIILELFKDIANWFQGIIKDRKHK